MSAQLIRFVLVGITAMLIHWITVIALVPMGLNPLTANIIAFSIAFFVSYSGHSYWTFLTSHLTHKYRFPRFFIIAVSSFIVNETIYFLLLRHTALDYRTALVIVLGSVSILTFIFSKAWAFRTE